jgi:hypothetical protein
VSQSKEKRKQRREMRLIQQEATWLQKAVFAFGKVEDLREKVADLNEADPEPLTVQIDGRAVSLDDVSEALEEKVQGTLEMLRERRGMVPRT